MTSSERALRVVSVLGLGGALAGCGLGLSGELVGPTAGPGGNPPLNQGGGSDGSGTDAEATGDPDADPDAAATGDGAVDPPDGASDSSPIVGCNYNGDWATKLTIP